MKDPKHFAFQFSTATITYKAFEKDGKYFLKASAVKEHEIYEGPEIVEIPKVAFNAIVSAHDHGIYCERSRISRVLGLDIRL